MSNHNQNSHTPHSNRAQNEASGKQADEPIAKVGFFSVEVALPQNRQLIFAPTGEHLRGRWDFQKVLAQEMGKDLRSIVHEVPAIPGVWIEIHLSERWVRVCDPLEMTAEGKEIYRKLLAIAERNPRLFGNATKAHPDVKDVGVTDTTLKNWMYHTTRLVNASKVIVNKHSEKFPEDLREINALPGMIDIQPFSVTAPRAERYVKEVAL